MTFCTALAGGWLYAEYQDKNLVFTDSRICSSNGDSDSSGDGGGVGGGGDGGGTSGCILVTRLPLASLLL